MRRNRTIMDRLERNRIYRMASERATTVALAATPGLFGEIRHTGRPCVIVPRHSSERRDYVPMLLSDGSDIAHDSCMFVPGATLFDFGVLSSAMHMSWLRHIGGRIKSDYRYSANLVLNTFPWPVATAQQRARIEDLARQILDQRTAYPASTLADLYDPDTMPRDLTRAHHALDAAVDRLYRPAVFASDRGRAEHLFGLYENLVAPLAALALRRPGRRRTRIVADVF